MSFQSEFRAAFEGVRRSFPFENYLDEATYHESYALAVELRRNLGRFEGKRLLDLGCGPMDKTAILQQLGFRCTGVDDLGDPWHRRGENLRRIEEFARSFGIDFRRESVGERTVPLMPRQYDVACAIGVVEHLHESPRELLNTMGRCVRPGGLVVLMMPNAVNLRKRLSVLIGRTNYVPANQFFHSVGDWRGHVREYTLAETRYICGEAGFEILSARTYECLAHVKLRPPLRQLYQVLTRVIPGSQSGLLVVGRRPWDWQPLQADPEAFRRAISTAVPAAVA